MIHSLFNVDPLMKIIIEYVDSIDFKLSDQDIISQEDIDKNLTYTNDNDNLWSTLYADYPIRCIPNLDVIIKENRDKRPYDEKEIEFSVNAKYYWSHILTNRCIPDTFYEEHIDIVDWSKISQNVALSIHFIEKYWRYFDFTGIFNNINLTVDFVVKFYGKIKCWDLMHQNKYIPEEIFAYHIQREEKKNELNWKKLCKSRNLSKEFVNTYKEYVNWISIYNNEYMDKDVRCALIKDNNINLQALATGDLVYKILSYKEIDRMASTIGVNWRKIKITKHTPLWFIRKYKDKLIWTHYMLKDFNSSYIEEFETYIVEASGEDLINMLDALDDDVWKISYDFREANIQKYKLYSSHDSVVIISRRLLTKLFKSMKI